MAQYTTKKVIVRERGSRRRKKPRPRYRRTLNLRKKDGRDAGRSARRKISRSIPEKKTGKKEEYEEAKEQSLTKGTRLGKSPAGFKTFPDVVRR